MGGCGGATPPHPDRLPITSELFEGNVYVFLGVWTTPVSLAMV